jgi:hypothetical protein
MATFMCCCAKVRPVPTRGSPGRPPCGRWRRQALPRRRPVATPSLAAAARQPLLGVACAVSIDQYTCIHREKVRRAHTVQSNGTVRVKPFLDSAMRERYQPTEAARRAPKRRSGTSLAGHVNAARPCAAGQRRAARPHAGRSRPQAPRQLRSSPPQCDESGDHRHHDGIARGRLLHRDDVAEGPTLLGVPLLTFFGLLGYLIAFVNSLWIIFSIWRSIGNEGSDQACGRRVAFQVGLPWITISMKNDWKRIFCVRAVSLAEDARRA